MIKPLLKKKKAPSKAYYQKKCDNIYQEIGRELNSSCLICGGEYSCLHHWVRKSQSTALRYDLENGIPICAKCHCKIHTGQDNMTAGRIIIIKGNEWFENLEAKKRLGLGLNYGITWYKEQYERLKLLKK